MRNCFKYLILSNSTSQGAAIATLSVALLASTATGALAQNSIGYDNTPPPPLSVSSPYGRSGTRGEYVLPGTRTKSSTTTTQTRTVTTQKTKPTTARKITTQLPSLPIEQIKAPQSLSSGGLPSPRRLSTPSAGTINLPNHRVSTPYNLRYATPATPTARRKPYYPKPQPAQQQQPVAIAQPMPQLQPQTPVAQPSATPSIPFGMPSKPLEQEQKILVTAPPATAPAPVIMVAPQPQPVAPKAPTQPEPRIITRPAISAPHPTPIPEPQQVMPIQPPKQQATHPAEPMPWDTNEQHEHILVPPSTVAKKESVTAEFDAIISDTKNEMQVPAQPSIILSEEPDIPPAPLPELTSIPLETESAVQRAETMGVEIADVPALSPESRAIINKTPSGIDSTVVARTPKPVIIKRTDPAAGNIPAIDVRSHEEMGMKIEIRDADINVHHYLEQGYENLVAGREAVAAGYYSEALTAEPRNEMALFGLATTYQRMNQTDEARKLYGDLLKINPTHREALNNFMALISEEAPQEAIVELEKLETENPNFSPIPAQLGIVYQRLGDNGMAIKKLIRALELSPENTSYKYNLAITLDAMGRRRDAAEMYMELIEDYNNGANLPGDIVTIRNRAIFLNAKG